jgi:hypothetical protein
VAKKKQQLANVLQLEELIREIPGQKVILDSDLARIYGVPTKALNQAVKRNAEKFPSDFMFRLTVDERRALQRSRSQIVTLKRGQNIKFFPYAFTEHGAIMAIND